MENKKEDNYRKKDKNDQEMALKTVMHKNNVKSLNFG